MKKCPYCAEEIQDDAIVCKHCGRDLTQPIQKPTKKGPKVILFVILALVVICAIIGIIAATSNKSTSTKVGESTGSPTNVSTDIPASNHYKIGDIIQIGDLTMTVNGISFPKGDQYMQPDTGNKFAVVDITFQNNGTKSQDISSLLQMTLKDETGQDYSISISAETASGGKSPDGEIAAGEKLRGQVGFEIPTSAKGLQFVYDASLFGSGKVFVDLGQ